MNALAATSSLMMMIMVVVAAMMMNISAYGTDCPGHSIPDTIRHAKATTEDA